MQFVVIIDYLIFLFRAYDPLFWLSLTVFSVLSGRTCFNDKYFMARRLLGVFRNET